MNGTSSEVSRDNHLEYEYTPRGVILCHRVDTLRDIVCVAIHVGQGYMK